MLKNIENKVINEKMADEVIKKICMLLLNATGKKLRDKILTNLYLEESYIELLIMFGDEKNELQELEKLLNVKITRVKSQLIKNKFYELLSNQSIGEKTIVIIVEDYAKWLGASQDEFLIKLKENTDIIISLEKNRIPVKNKIIETKEDYREPNKKLKFITIFLITVITIGNILFYIKNYSTYIEKNNKVTQNNSKENVINEDMQAVKNINESLLEFETPILQFHTLKNIIRIDKLNNGKYRYASFTYPKTTMDLPDTIIHTGYFDEKTSSFKFNVTFLGIVYAVVMDAGKPKKVNIYNNKQLLQNYEMKSIDYVNINEK